MRFFIRPTVILLSQFVRNQPENKLNRSIILNRSISTAVVWRAMEDKEALKKRLTPLQYHVTQEAGTERPFTGCYNKFYKEGLYVCVVCRQDLFTSKTKFDSGCGWPAFNDVLSKEKVTLHQDTSAAHIMDTLTTDCAYCTAQHKHNAKMFIHGVKKFFPDGYIAMKKKYDPEDKLFKPFEVDMEKF